MDTLTTAITALIEQTAVVAKPNTNEEHVKSFADSLSQQISQANAEAAKPTDLVLPTLTSGSNDSAPDKHAVYGKRLQTGESSVSCCASGPAEMTKSLQSAVNEPDTTDSETAKNSSATTDDVTGSQTSNPDSKVTANKAQNNMPVEITGTEAVDAVSIPADLWQTATNPPPTRRLQTVAIEGSQHNVRWNQSKHSKVRRESVPTATESGNGSATKCTDKPNGQPIHSATTNTNEIAAITIGISNCAVIPFVLGAPSLCVPTAATAACELPVTSRRTPMFTISTGQQNAGLQAACENGKSNVSIPAAKDSAGDSIVTPLAGDHGSALQDKPGLGKMFLPGQNGDACSKLQGIILPATATQPTVGTNGFTIGAASSIAVLPGAAVTASIKGQDNCISDRMPAAHREAWRGYDAAPGIMSLTTGGVHKTLLATQTTLEVAVPDGTQGWLKVRAEMVGGGAITASLSAESPSGQEALHRELPSLTAFLQQERIAVNTVVVHQGPTRPMGGGQAGSLGGGMTGQLQQGGGQGREKPRTFGAFAFNSPFGRRNVAGPSEARAHLSYNDNGSWLSVRA